MGKLIIAPDEKRDCHCKVYVEPSVFTAIKDHQTAKGMYSFSDAARDLIVTALMSQ
jgi:hypothetical protein